MKIFNIEPVLERTGMQVIDETGEHEYISDNTVYKIVVCNREDFQKFLSDRNITNTEEIEDCVFISIVDGFPFLKEHSNAISLEFMDAPADMTFKDGYIYRSISKDDAKRLCTFIHNNMNKNFIIHCEAGVSRSQQVANYIMLKGHHEYDEKLSTHRHYKDTIYTIVLKRLLDAQHELYPDFERTKREWKYDPVSELWTEI